MVALLVVLWSSRRSPVAPVSRHIRHHLRRQIRQFIAQRTPGLIPTQLNLALSHNRTGIQLSDHLDHRNAGRPVSIQD